MGHRTHAQGRGSLLRALVVDDSHGDADLLKEYLSEECQVWHAESLAAASALMATQRFDVALVDASLPDASGIQAVESLVRLGKFPVILVTGTDSDELGAAAAKCGAHKYIVKGEFTARHLVRAVNYAVEHHESLIQFRALLYQSPDGVLIVDPEGVVLLANRAACEAFDVSERELLGCSIGTPSAQITELLLPRGRTIEIHSAEVPWQRRRAFLIHLRDVTERNRMVSQLAEANRKLEDLAINDPLTKLLNRRGAENMLGHLMAASSRSDESVTAVLVDCDDFKSINETGGYTAGDEALQLVADAMRSSTRPACDQVCRIGGDEFLVLLPATTTGQACLVAQRIREAVRARPLVLASGIRRLITVSIGVTLVPPHVVTLKEVIGLAEAAVHQSKHTGKDRISLAATGDPCAQALASGEREIELHAVVEGSARSAAGYELRLREPAFGDGANSPTQVDLRCLRACLDAAASTLPGDERVYVNLSPSTLLESPVADLAKLLAPFRSRLVVLLNEREFIAEPAQLVPALDALRDVGVLIALDEVGFGKSSLESLVILEPDLVRLDCTQLNGTVVNPGAVRTLRRLTRCLRSLDVGIIARGVDDELLAQALEREGISWFQGRIAGVPGVLRKGLWVSQAA